jgi:hypothetical protein
LLRERRATEGAVGHAVATTTSASGRKRSAITGTIDAWETTVGPEGTTSGRRLLASVPSQARKPEPRRGEARKR